MKVESKNPSKDLPNQEKNQYWTVNWWETGALYTKIKGGSDQKDWIKKITDLLEEGELKQQEECVGMKIQAACLEWLYIAMKERQTKSRLFEKT